MAYMPREDNWETLAEQKLKTFDSLTHYTVQRGVVAHKS